jgi:CRISPR/Cas system CSM-associated protein Csm5 (group 7 of RAMP superfamily)
MCVEEQNDAIVMPENKEELVMNIMNSDEMESEEFPMCPEVIARETKKDTQLKEVMKRSEKFSERLIEISTVITNKNKIYIPQSLIKRILWWYHTYLQHPGITRMEVALRQNLPWSNLKKDVEAAVNNCHEYQIGNKVRNKYGDLPEKLAQRPIAWNRVDVELIGSLTINARS